MSAVDVYWITAFIDLPADGHEVGVRFWSAMTGFEPSPPRGTTGEFLTLLPATGAPHLAVQRIDEGPPGIHLDLHVTSVDAAAAAAVALGATVVARLDYTVMRSPGGYVFCFVDHPAGPEPAPAGGPGPIRPYQVSLDVPAERYDADVAFWSSLLGDGPIEAADSDFTAIRTDAPLPVRLLCQRLGPGDDGGARAHLDVAAGVLNGDIATDQVALGAEVVGTFEHWIALRDPAGMDYCLTTIDPVTGRRPG
ncbi:MAG: VOC family protein [Actinomycetota bacterium]